MERYMALGLAAIFLLAASALFPGMQFAENTLCSGDPRDSEVEVFFCPEDNCSEKIIAAIRGAEESIDVASYSFTLGSISEALSEAKKRGVEVGVVLDAGQAASSYSEDGFLEGKGIFLVRKGEPGLMHNKFIVVDEEVVATGSFNYSKSGDTKNDENLVFIYNKDVAEKYSMEFDELVLESGFYGEGG